MTLEWVNEQRADMGLDPIVDFPQGQPADATSCLIANALTINPESGIKVSTTRYATLFFGGWRYLDRLDHPDYVQHVITAFDLGIRPRIRRYRHGRTKPEDVIAPKPNVVEELATLEAEHGFRYRLRRVFDRVLARGTHAS